MVSNIKMSSDKCPVVHADGLKWGVRVGRGIHILLEQEEMELLASDD